MTRISSPLTMPAAPADRRRFLQWLVAGVPLVLLPAGAALPSGCGRVAGTDRFQLALVPESQMVALSDQTWQEITASERPLTSGPEVAMVQRLGKRLQAQAPSGSRAFAFTVLDSDQVNAFALPNGQVAIYRGLLPYCRNEAALGTVIGHEIGHIVAKHGNERMTQQLATGAILQLAAAGIGSTEADPATQQVALAALGAGAQFGVLLPFSRKHEYEADRLGVTYLAKAGYEPGEAVRFWQRFAAGGGGKAPEFFSTHPSDANRIATLQEAMGSYQAAYQRAGQRYGLGDPIAS